MADQLPDLCVAPLKTDFTAEFDVDLDFTPDENTAGLHTGIFIWQTIPKHFR
jgi:hypothetical protein